MSRAKGVRRGPRVSLAPVSLGCKAHLGCPSKVNGVKRVTMAPSVQLDHLAQLGPPSRALKDQWGPGAYRGHVGHLGQPARVIEVRQDPKDPLGVLGHL